ncbi:c-type cytochrome [Teichococcus vastitatis]|uniref:Cytochrome c n=1 Tax=Teichococcus vastitatis TaxID=2307076 RepID=A0ABS9W6Q4_9PROT|nr:cytochrome c [Pseudoroseomonas vastitatis]MCI0754903.1 cytochrome c [Pseudoroseomonas vastitatis]
MRFPRERRAWLAWAGLTALLLVWAASRPGPAAPASAPSAELGPSSPSRWRFRAAVWAAMVLLLLGGLGLSGWSFMQRRERQAIATALTGGDPHRGPDLMTRYGCGGCHTIPGVPGADGKVAGPLSGMRERVFVGGVARNSPEPMIRWIVDPRALSPQTAMPATGITEAEARDVAAYLYAR